MRSFILILDLERNGFFFQKIFANIKYDKIRFEIRINSQLSLKRYPAGIRFIAISLLVYIYIRNKNKPTLCIKFFMTIVEW